MKMGKRGVRYKIKETYKNNTRNEGKKIKDKTKNVGKCSKNELKLRTKDKIEKK